MWQKSLRSDNEYTPNSKLTFASPYVCIQYDYTGNEKVLFINKEDTTSTRWTNPGSGGFVDRFYQPQLGIILVAYRAIYAGHDAASMEQITTVPNNLQFFAQNRLIGENVYANLRDYQNKINYIYRFNLFTREKSIDYEISDSECPECKIIIIYPPTLVVTQNGDSLLNYKRHFSKIDGESITEIETYKLRNGNKSLIWRSNDRKAFIGTIGTCLYQGISVGINNPIYAIDVYTGKIVWEQPNNVKGSDWYTIVEPVLIDNKIYLTSSGRFYVVNADNGVVEYESDVIYSSSTESKLTYF